MSLRLFLCGLIFVPAAFAAEPAPRPVLNQQQIQDLSMVPITETPGLPRVLLIGDSISMGYTVPVRTQLAGKANVLRPPENCGESAKGVKQIDAWLGAGKWDVIHFNFGLHDVKYLDPNGKYVTPDKGKQVASTAEYEKNLRTVVARLKQTGARLIFATTTPVPSQSSGRVENDELRYNEVAVRVMKELGVAIDDLHAAAKTQQAKIQQPHNVHFTPEGYEVLANTVVAAIKSALATP
jgi:lysophospholipase L1-like esterase